MKPLPRAMYVLSSVALAGAASASVTTLSYEGAFPSPAPAPPFNGALAEARGWSVVTLLIVLPALLAASIGARRGSLASRLVWLGTLAYLVYTYLEFAVSPPFTPLYLIYIATFACALAALVMGVSAIDPEEVARSFGGSVPRRAVAAYGLVSAIFLSLAWLKGIATETMAGQFGWPSGESAIGHVVHALDLGLQVPLCIGAALLLLRKRPGGYVAAGVMLVNSVCMGAALTAMVATSALFSGKSLLMAAPFAVVPLVALVLAIFFFRAARGGDGLAEREREHSHADPGAREPGNFVTRGSKAGWV